MKLLICNDDGIDSEGIITLARELAKGHEVAVVAPDGERSASGHATTLRSPIISRKTMIDGSILAYALSGTPSDCAKFGLRHLFQSGVDMVVSGINRGRNIGTDVLYSGTVSAAIEGLLCGVRSIAVSHSGREYHFGYAAQFISKNLSYFYSCAERSVLNINFPDCLPENIKGVKAAPLGKLFYNDRYNTLEDGSFQLYSLPQGAAENPVHSDVSYSEKNYITITPLMIDLTDYEALKTISEKAVKL